MEFLLFSEHFLLFCYWCVVLSGKDFSPSNLDSLMEPFSDPVAVWPRGCAAGDNGSVGTDVGELLVRWSRRLVLLQGSVGVECVITMEIT